MNLNKKHQEAWEKIKQADNILLVTHLRPDGDAISSVCAMIDLLENIDKKYSAFCDGKIEESFSYLAHIEKINTKKEMINFSKHDLIIILDCGSMARTSLTEEIKNKSLNQTIIEFDHHPQVDNYANIEIRNPQASATTEVIYDFFKINKLKINKNIANCILTGIFTDTANLFYPNTSDKTIRISSEMMIYGAQLPQIIQNTWYNKNLTAMKIWGVALNNLKINKKYNLAFSVLTQKDIKEAGAENINKDIYSSIAGFLGNLHKVKAIMLIIEEENGIIKTSLRSSDPNVDVSKLAKFMGGGGHTKAASFIISGKILKNGKNYKII